MQLAIGASLACVALTLPATNFVRYSLAIFWIMAFSSATHDIAADGFYMLGLDTPQQAAFVGVRVIFYRIATIAAEGGLVFLVGMLENTAFRRLGPGRWPLLVWALFFWRFSSIMFLRFRNLPGMSARRGINPKTFWRNISAC